MNPDQIKESIQAVADGLTPLAQKLQIPLDGLYRWAILHNYAVALSGLLPLIFLPITMGLAFKLNKKADWENPEIYSISVVVLGGLSILMILFTVISIQESVERLIAPQWFAAQDISTLIRGK